jgi:hypothetical protein
MSRYIDADAFSEKMKRQYCENCDNYQGMRCKACPNGDWLDDLYDQPTADVRENVKGKWIVESVDLFHGEEVGESYICSVCFKDAFDKFDFCPYCGADMRGEA